MSLLPLDPRLLDHLAVEFGDHGRRAVEFLQTAQGLLQAKPDTGLPRLAETVAYCLREAMKTIPMSQTVEGGGLWRSASRGVVDARRRFDLVRNVPGEDARAALESLLTTIDDLENVHAQEGIHERRLIAIMLRRTGALPLDAGTAPVRAYQSLLGDLDQALHSEVGLDDAQRLWNQCADVLRQLFLPPDLRHGELDALAAQESVGPEDVSKLLPLIAGPNHLRYFLSRIQSPEWLHVLTETGMLNPPTANGPWPVFSAIDHLGSTHGRELAHWLERIYERRASDDRSAWFVARAAVDIGEEAAQLSLRVLRDHLGAPAVVSLGVMAAEKVDPASGTLEEFADILLSTSAWDHDPYIDPVLQGLQVGLSQDNAARRLQLLCWKLRRVDNETGDRRLFDFDRGGSLADWKDGWGKDRFSVLIGALASAIRRSHELIHLEEILRVTDTLSDGLRGRVRAFVLATAPGVQATVMIDEVARAIVEREPTGDDLALVDYAVANSAPDKYVAAWAQSLGPAPSVAEVGRKLHAHELPTEWLRAFHWSGVLPADVVTTWERAVSVIAAAYGRPTRQFLEERRQVEASWGQSPITSEVLESWSVPEAAANISAWRPDPSQWLVSARELARTLEQAVKGNPADWLASPLSVVTALRHPTYVHHYLLGMAEAIRAGSVPPVEETMDLLGLVRANPWDVVPLGKDDFDYDHDWQGAEQAAVGVIKALADKDVGFGGRDDEIWDVLDEEVRDRGAASIILEGARDPLQSAINRRCTRALEAVLSFMAYEFRAMEHTREAGLTLLEDSLYLEGSDGAEHRAIIATRLGFLRRIAPEWVDRTETLLFGAEAPDGLAQATADLAIKWGQPNPWFLERHRRLVQDAISRDVDNALEHFLLAMLWGLPGYAYEDCVDLLKKSPARLSKAGEKLGRLLKHGDVEESHITCAVDFWRAAVAVNQPEALLGFGWMADVAGIADVTWATLTLDTLAVTGGRVDWSQAITKRAVSLPPSTQTLAIMNSLVRGIADDWDRRRIVESAVQLLRGSDALASTPEYQRLRTTLLERGAL